MEASQIKKNGSFNNKWNIRNNNRIRDYRAMVNVDTNKTGIRTQIRAHSYKIPYNCGDYNGDSFYIEWNFSSYRSLVGKLFL